MRLADLSDKELHDRMREVREQYIAACNGLRAAEDCEFDVRKDLDALRTEIATRKLGEADGKPF